MTNAINTLKTLTINVLATGLTSLALIGWVFIVYNLITDPGQFVFSF